VANAVVTFIAFCALVLSTLQTRPSRSNTPAHAPRDGHRPMRQI
jgi:hypothetical protein